MTPAPQTTGPRRSRELSRTAGARRARRPCGICHAVRAHQRASVRRGAAYQPGPGPGRGRAAGGLRQRLARGGRLRRRAEPAADLADQHRAQPRHRQPAPRSRRSRSCRAHRATTRTRTRRVRPRRRRRAGPARTAAPGRGRARARRAAWRALSAPQRQSVALAFYDGLSHAEVAAQMRQPLGTVKSWVRRALLALKDCLDRRASTATRAAEMKHPNSSIGMPAFGPLRTLARLRTFVACEAFTVVASTRARLRAGGPVRSAVGGRRCAPTPPLRCSVPRPAANSLRELRSLRSDNCRESVHEARWRARPRALRCRRRPFAPGPTRPQPCGQRQLVFERSRNTTVPGPEGSALTGRMGAGEQRSAERGSPAYPPGRREAVRWVPRSAAPTAASQPPSRSEQRSAPSPQARAATPKPRQGTALGPRANATQRALANVRNGPFADLRSVPRFMRRGSRQVRWDN